MTKKKGKSSNRIRKARERIKKFHDPPQVDLHKTLDALKKLANDAEEKEDKKEGKGKKK